MADIIEPSPLNEIHDYLFEFSVVMAVYNVEPFLDEAVESLIQQDLGFEHIQLIMVDDGSTDGSGAICDCYAEQYPDNVVVIHKANGGVSSARNEGITHATGRFINFLDADDRLAVGTMRKVVAFFEQHSEETDVVAIPMRFFDGYVGEHPLNEKFKKGSRVINLIKEWKTIQLSMSSVFVKASICDQLHFDETLAYCEDGKELLKLLRFHMALGVLNNTTYHYRKRTEGSASAIQSSTTDTGWYLPHLQGFAESSFDFYNHALGYVPLFVQNAIMYDLKWRVIQREMPNKILGETLAQVYIKQLYSLISKFDDNVILAQDIQIEYKLFLLKHKYGRQPDVHWNHNHASLYYPKCYICDLQGNKTRLDFFTFDGHQMELEGYTVLLGDGYNTVSIALDVNGELYPCEPVERDENRYALGEVVYMAYGFKGIIPLNSSIQCYEISVVCLIDGHRLDKDRLLTGKHFPISQQYIHSYYYKNGYVLTLFKNKLILTRCGLRGRIKYEYKFIRELWHRKTPGGRKAIVARQLSRMLKIVIRKPIWLISDRVNKADDNGEAFFRFLAEKNEKNIFYRFAISLDSYDYKDISKIGRTIPFLGWRYKLLYLCADCVISSQGEEYIFRPFQKYSALYQDMSQQQKFIFLQHGVIKDDLSRWLNRYNKNIAMFVTTTRAEYQSILSANYYYTEKVVKLTGLPRYDRLYRDEKKLITIMPTWRAYLVGAIDPATGKRLPKSGFKDTCYFDMYDRLLNSTRLLNVAQKLGYQLRFLTHPNMLCAESLMTSDERLVRLPGDTPYRKIFAESDLIVTDYSSIAFDFAYLRKPVLYYQADYDEFFSGAHTYDKGYFDYNRNGFGEVEYDTEILVDRIIDYMKNDCTLKPKYRARIDETFPYSDQFNCKRVYDTILDLGK